MITILNLLHILQFRDGLESRISDYEITGNQVILQIDSVSICSHDLWVMSNKH